MSVERIVNAGQRDYFCNRCMHIITRGDRRRTRTYFPSEMHLPPVDEEGYKTRPTHVSWHLNCEPWA